MTIKATDFADFFHAIHGCEPFPWQQALVNELDQNNKWPDVIDLPTGTGKTAVLDIALFYLALRADAECKPARRITFVVDRRLVVDDAFARAEKIEKVLIDSSQSENADHKVVKEVANRLRYLTGDKDKPPPFTPPPPLIVKRLRGGVPLEYDWARTPTQPTILCSTVDQIGSRLLFRGYGVSHRMKPVHAGLLGEDNLIFLDEVHLSEPFRQTLSAVRQVGKANVNAVLLSATPGIESENTFYLLLDDYANEVLNRRLMAEKPVTLRKLDKEKPVDAFACEAIAMMERLTKSGVVAPAVGIVVNRVALARGIFDSLNKGSVSDAILMIGRSRDVDRDRLAESIKPFRTGNHSERAQVTTPLYIVATQCLEVGVDLDLDGLVTQAASLDALRQRFGRLNRDGRSIQAEGSILASKEDLAKKNDDPVYGDRIQLTWKMLEKIADESVVDFGIHSLTEQLKSDPVDISTLAAPRADAPVLMHAYLDLWSQTSPIPTADPEVGLFLHGIERASADVAVVWRSDITHRDLENETESNLKELIRLVPPKTAEAIEIPLWVARTWLAESRAKMEMNKDDNSDNNLSLGNLADVPMRHTDKEEPAHVAEKPCAFRWAGADDVRTSIVSPDDLRPGDTLIVPSLYGGCDAFGWAPDSKASVVDVADDAAQPFRSRRYAVRIAPDVVSESRWTRVATILDDSSGRDGSQLIERLLEALPGDGADGQENNDSDVILRHVHEPLEALRGARRGIDIHFPYKTIKGSCGGVVLVASKGLIGMQKLGWGIPATESDDQSQNSSKPIRLDDHGCHVAEMAERFAQTLGLSPEIVADIKLAAWLHDAGKADGRFQTMLAGGDIWNQPDRLALAKSGRPYSPTAWKRSGLPPHWRHEALSVNMARHHPDFGKANDAALVLWLIGTHHGCGRPFFNFIDWPESGTVPELRSCLNVDSWSLKTTPGPQSLSFDFNGSDWPRLFENLKQKYGIWHLAWLETIVRLADHRASEEESRNDD